MTVQPSESSDPVVRSDAFDEKLKNSNVIHALVGLGLQNRRNIRIAFISIIVDVLLSIGLGYSILRIEHLFGQQVIACEANNVSRAGQVTLWSHVLLISAPKNSRETPQEYKMRVKQAVDFKNYVKTLFAQQDCNNLKVHPTPTPTTH